MLRDEKRRNRTKELSSVKVPDASAGVNGSSFHLSNVSSLSQGFSFLYVEGIVSFWN